MTFHELRQTIAADQFRYDGGSGARDFWRQWCREGGFRFTVVMRFCTFLRTQWWSRWVIFHLMRFWHRQQQVRYGIYLNYESKIGPGLYIGHPLSIVVNTKTMIGRNCSLGHGVTLGQTHARSKAPGCPVIGDNVYLGPGACVIGGIQIGDDAVIGPNSVVIKDVPRMAVVSGIPAQILSMKGSDGYVSQKASDCVPHV